MREAKGALSMTVNSDRIIAEVAADHYCPELEATSILPACERTSVSVFPSSGAGSRRDSKYGRRSSVVLRAELDMGKTVPILMGRGPVKLHNPPRNAIRFFGQVEASPMSLRRKKKA
jgi:hypothetical protein